MIYFKKWKAFFGPNLYSRDPVIEVIVEVDNKLHENIDEYCYHMNNSFNTWWKGITRKQEQKFDLFAGIYIAEWAHAALNEFRGFIDARGALQKDNHIVIWLGHHNPELSYASLKLAAYLLISIKKKKIQKKKLDDILNDFWSKCKSMHPDYQAKILMEAARARNIPYFLFMERIRVWQFGYGKNSLKFFESSSNEDSHVGFTISHNKVSSKKYLELIGAPIAKHILIREEKQLYNAVKKIGFPCVIKPIDKGSAKGVSVNIKNISEAEKAYKHARSHSKSPIMIESFVDGDVYRLLIVRGELVAATRRVPAHITGDGIHTILQLSHEFNKSRTINKSPGSYLGPAPLDDEFDRVVSEQGYERHMILEAGRTIKLRDIPLQGTGATNVDVTHLVHTDIINIAKAIAGSIALNIVGIDYITSNISKSHQEMGAFLEINLTPSIRGHLENGKDVRNIADMILGNKPGRIPSALLVVSNFDFSIIENLVRSKPEFGWRHKNSAGFGNTKLFAKHTHPFDNVKMLLLNTCISKILIICTKEEVSKYGMPLDHFDHCFIESDDINPETLDVLNKYSTNLRIFNKSDNISNLIQDTFNIKINDNESL